jgi:hypothetical protein
MGPLFFLLVPVVLIFYYLQVHFETRHAYGAADLLFNFFTNCMLVNTPHTHQTKETKLISSLEFTPK